MHSGSLSTPRAVADTCLLLLLLPLSPCRNFRTFTAPSAVQFISLAVENSGEVVAAGSQDDFQVRGRLNERVSELPEVPHFVMFGQGAQSNTTCSTHLCSLAHPVAPLTHAFPAQVWLHLVGMHQHVSFPDSPVLCHTVTSHHTLPCRVHRSTCGL
jgi:hypothetical protein